LIDWLGGPTLTARGIGVRPSRADDAPFERALFETARPDADFLAGWPPAMRKTFLDQQFQFQSIHYARAYPDADRLLVLGQSEPIGRLIVDRAPAGWCLVDIALLAAWRGQGLGTLLLRAIQAAATDAKAPSMSLTVDMLNPARRLYARLGFTALEESIPDVAMAWRPAG
jgi:GNAT superfamily N-acetyltransferase